MKNLEPLSLDELDQLKYTLDFQMQDLRDEKRGSAAKSELTEERRKFINKQLADLRAQKMAVQREQDRRMKLLSGLAAHTIGRAGGIQSEEHVGGLG